ncbi:hypothetical protein QLQ12_14405 [Actinoplanes sp. NEAU-A12]|uniref:Uncharacterized protein n=1 Tax=Actinoplanes sandaracinus TaxID=3045177 RepID=A0ABT6WJ91_9ACTN|nr:hypothetical protein [Actinoplanes sandaracinus]MDI6099792.1 hypothetical protein [Actinoplanes sandaracinus]
MTNEPNPPQDERNEPNEFGFAGAATAPQPRPKPSSTDGEQIAVPSGDLTGALGEAIEERTARNGD